MPAVTAFSDLLCECGVAGPVKRHTAVHQCIEQNSQGPAVHLADRKTHTHAKMVHYITGTKWQRWYCRYTIV